jgi:hypothetical protein
MTVAFGIINLVFCCQVFLIEFFDPETIDQTKEYKHDQQKFSGIKIVKGKSQESGVR